MSYPSVHVEAPEFNGVRVNHPTILTYIRNAIKQGYGNEQICKIVGVPSEVVDRERSKLRKITAELK